MIAYRESLREFKGGTQYNSRSQASSFETSVFPVVEYVFTRVAFGVVSQLSRLLYQGRGVVFGSIRFLLFRFNVLSCRLITLELDDH